MASHGGCVAERIVARSEPDPNSGCWLWTGATDGRYGSISVGGKLIKTHRVMYEAKVGVIPEGMVVCHQCDTPLCVRPDHLFVATQHVNLMDCAAKGRNGMQRYPERSRIKEFSYDCSGEKHHNATISDFDAARLFVDAQDGCSVGHLAARYGVSKSTALRISTGKSRRSATRAAFSDT